MEPRVPIPPKVDNYAFDGYNITTVVHHIMGTKCDRAVKCEKSSENEVNKGSEAVDICNVCKYEYFLNLESIPDMIFAENKLIIECNGGGSIEFNPLDALKLVGKTSNHVQVAHAKAWQEARADCEFAQKIVKDYDWTYSTTYSGTVKGTLKVEASEERIDLEKLKVPEQILFYKEIYLYEDELDDNGSTKCTVKVRVMPSGFFVVFRHYLRIDHVMIRVCDTRLYHEKGKRGILREISLRESPMNEIKVEAATYKNPDAIWQHLKLLEEQVELITSSETSK